MIDTSFLIGAPPTPLLTPYEVQARKLAMANALAGQQMQQQQLESGALELGQKRQAIADAEATRAAITNYYGGGNALAPGAMAPAPPPAGMAPTGTAGDLLGGSDLSPSVASAPGLAATGSLQAAATPAGAPAVRRPPTPTMADLIRAGVPPGAASGIVENFQKIDKNAADIDEKHQNTAKLAGELHGAITEQLGLMASSVLKSGLNPAVAQFALENFASHGPEYAERARGILGALQKNPQQAPAILQQLADAGEKSRMVGAREGEVANQVRKTDAELPGTTADSSLKQATAAGKAPIQPYQRAQLGLEAQRNQLEGQRVNYEGQRVANERRKTEFDQGAIQRAGESLGHGELTRISDIASLRGDQRLQIYDIAKRINPNFNVSEVDRKVKNEDYYANGKGADSLRSFNTFLEHAGSASDAVNNIRLSGVPIINKPLNWWREHMAGSADLQRLVTSLEPVRKEFEGYLLGGHALQAGDRKAADVILNENSSPAQIQEALKTMGHTAVARSREENYRYKKVSGHDLVDPFSPEALAGARSIGASMNFGMAGANAGSTPAAPGGKPLADHSTQDLLKMLGSGAQ